MAHHRNGRIESKKKEKHAQPISISTTTTTERRKKELRILGNAVAALFIEMVWIWKRALAHFNIVTVAASRYAATWGHVWKMKSFKHLKCNCLNESFFWVCSSVCLQQREHTHDKVIDENKKSKCLIFLNWSRVANASCYIHRAWCGDSCKRRFLHHNLAFHALQSTFCCLFLSNMLE